MSEQWHAERAQARSEMAERWHSERAERDDLRDRLARAEEERDNARARMLADVTKALRTKADRYSPGVPGGEAAANALRQAADGFGVVSRDREGVFEDLCDLRRMIEEWEIGSEHPRQYFGPLLDSILERFGKSAPSVTPEGGER